MPSFEHHTLIYTANHLDGERTCMPDVIKWPILQVKIAYILI